MNLRTTLEIVRSRGTTHAGLWLERYLRDPDGEGAKQKHIAGALSSIHPPEGYAAHVAQWRQGLATLAPFTAMRDVAANGRLVVGLGGESVLETAITLHRTWGTPYLPGSALKGLTARYAARALEDEAWRKSDGASYRAMFGVQESAGHVVFHDALWVPSKGDGGLPLDLDVMTVHHPDYYQQGAAPPADWDNPNPVPFVTARGTYLLAVTGPEPWAKAAMEILLLALAEEGVGAKTAAGYGRMRPTATPAAPAPPTAPNWQLVVNVIEPGDAAHRVPELLKGLSGKERSEAAKAIVAKLGRKWLKDRAEKEWVKALFEAAG